MAEMKYGKTLTVKDDGTTEIKAGLIEPKLLETKIPVRFDLIDPNWLYEIAKVLEEGSQKYGDNSWKQLTIDTNINHALAHINAFQRGEATDEDDLINTACRIMFAWVLSHEKGR